MSEESTKKSTKKHQKSGEREHELPKAKKSKRFGLTAENSHDHCKGLQRSSLPITKLDSTRDSKLDRKLGDPLSMAPPDTLGKVKVSKKRKRSNCDAIPDEFANGETGTAELEPPPKKRRDEHRDEGSTHRLPCPNPAIDESLSEQSRRALLYVYQWCRGIDIWKFNKAKQNWLLRNVWSAQAVPESYIPLAIEYLAGIRGGAREKLIDECISRSSPSERAPVQGTQPSDGSNNVEFANNQRANTSRALSILDALHQNS